MDASFLSNNILNNPVVTGLSVSAMLGGAAYQLRRIPHWVAQGAMRFFTVELTVLSTDSAFASIERWLERQPYNKTSKVMRVQARENESGEDVAEWTLAPGAGTHLFFWRRRPLVLRRHFLSKETADGVGRRQMRPTEQIHFRTIGRNQTIIRDLLSEARAMAAHDDSITVRVWNDYGWAKVRGRQPRRLDTIILKDGQVERIMNDLDWFLGARDWYHVRGIPYRRGYCFSGPPGTGKTSVVLALAGRLERPICVLNVAAIESDNALFDAFFTAPSNAIILIEDIDCAFPALDRAAGSDDSKPTRPETISKAGLLNALDGVTTPDGRIFIMTTNYPERLDAALMRPGRADVQETFDLLGPGEQQRMAARFATTPFEPLDTPVSPAAMQAAFMQHANDPAAARAQLQASTMTDVAPNRP